MACLLTSGRLLPCKDLVGGIKEVFLCSSWAEIKGSAEFTANELSGFDPATLYRYEIKDGTSAFTQTITSSEENGTIFYDQELTIQLNGINSTDRSEMMRIARNRRLLIFVRNNNDSILVMGWDRGAEVSAGTIETGANMGDFNGLKLTFKAHSINAAMFVEPYTLNPFDNITNATVSPAY